MSELSFEQMLDESFKTIRNGEVVEGTVIDVKDEEIILNIGYKADGILTKNEYSNDSNIDLHTVAQPGDKMEVKVLKVNDGEGQVLLTYKRLAAEKGNKRLEEAFENHEVLKAKVSQVLNGGLSVVIDEARIFIPASLVSDVYEKDLSKYADQEIEFVITEFNPRRRRIIGDRKQLIVEEKKKMQEELFARIAVGDTVDSLPVVRDVRLREIFGGAWEGKSVFEIARLYSADYALWQRDIGHARCTQGESLQELQRRAVPAVRAIAAEYEGRCGTVLVATHAAFLRTMQCYWQHIPPDGMKDVPWVPNASVTEVHYFPDGAFRLVRLAQVDFLQGEVTRISKGF